MSSLNLSKLEIFKLVLTFNIDTLILLDDKLYIDDVKICDGIDNKLVLIKGAVKLPKEPLDTHKLEIFILPHELISLDIATIVKSCLIDRFVNSGWGLIVIWSSKNWRFPPTQILAWRVFILSIIVEPLSSLNLSKLEIFKLVLIFNIDVLILWVDKLYIDDVKLCDGMVNILVLIKGAVKFPKEPLDTHKLETFILPQELIWLDIATIFKSYFIHILINSGVVFIIISSCVNSKLAPTHILFCFKSNLSIIVEPLSSLNLLKLEIFKLVLTFNIFVFKLFMVAVVGTIILQTLILEAFMVLDDKFLIEDVILLFAINTEDDKNVAVPLPIEILETLMLQTFSRTKSKFCNWRVVADKLTIEAFVAEKLSDEILSTLILEVV